MSPSQTLITASTTRSMRPTGPNIAATQRASPTRSPALVLVPRPSGAKADQYWFVTSNYQDFSVPNGDRRQPHPDLVDIFADGRTRYLYEPDGLKSALEEYFGDAFIELADETEFLQEEPRTFA